MLGCVPGLVSPLAVGECGEVTHVWANVAELSQNTPVTDQGTRGGAQKLFTRAANDTSVFTI